MIIHGEFLFLCLRHGESLSRSSLVAVLLLLRLITVFLRLLLHGESLTRKSLFSFLRRPFRPGESPRRRLFVIILLVLLRGESLLMRNFRYVDY